jgi:hypothetical protein
VIIYSSNTPGHVTCDLTVEELARIMGTATAYSLESKGKTLRVPSVIDRMEAALEAQGISPVISCGIAQFLHQALRLDDPEVQDWHTFEGDSGGLSDLPPPVPGQIQYLSPEERARRGRWKRVGYIPAYPDPVKEKAADMAMEALRTGRAGPTTTKGFLDELQAEFAAKVLGTRWQRLRTRLRAWLRTADAWILLGFVVALLLNAAALAAELWHGLR